VSRLYIFYKKIIVFLYKHKIIKDKIKLLESININLYDTKWGFIEYDFILGNIIDEIEFLKYVNSLDIKNKRIDIKINRKHTTFSRWYSDDGYYINQVYFYIWLNEVKNILKLNNNLKINTHILQYNNVKIISIQNEYNKLLDKVISVLKI
jgi:hypothetical protein